MSSRACKTIVGTGTSDSSIWLMAGFDTKASKTSPVTRSFPRRTPSIARRIFASSSSVGCTPSGTRSTWLNLAIRPGRYVIDGPQDGIAREDRPEDGSRWHAFGLMRTRDVRRNEQERPRPIMVTDREMQRGRAPCRSREDHDTLDADRTEQRGERVGLHLRRGACRHLGAEITEPRGHDHPVTRGNEVGRESSQTSIGALRDAMNHEHHRPLTLVDVLDLPELRFDGTTIECRQPPSGGFHVAPVTTYNSHRDHLPSKRRALTRQPWSWTAT